MDGLFLKVLNMSLSASWLILAVILLRRLLKKAPKWLNCVLWALVAVRLLCPISFESALSLVPNAEPIPSEIFMVEPPESHTNTVIDPITNPNLPDTPPVILDTSIDRVQTKQMFATLLWMGGVAVMLAYAVVSYLRLRYRVRASVHLRERIWVCDYIETPFILGFLWPRIYLPSGTEDGQMTHIIAHENAHLKRRDHWWKPLGFLMLAIHWFNPLVWVAYVLLCRDIELACDEKVIRDLNREESISYSKALLAFSVSRRTILVCPLAFGEVGVKERVKRVLNYKKPAFWIVIAAIVACVVVAACFLTNPASQVLSQWVIDEVNMESALQSAQAMTVSYGDEQISCNKAEMSGFVSVLDEVKVRKDPVSQNRSEDRETAFVLEINDDLRLNFSPDFSEIWVDNGVKPSYSYPVANPETARKLVTEFLYISINPSTSQWFDYLSEPDKMNGDGRLEINRPEFPDVTFRWYPGKIEAVTDAEITPLLTGMPIWNCFFCDLNGDGKPELCATASIGSGIIDQRVLVYDYVAGQSYELSDRSNYDYVLSLESGTLIASKHAYPISQNSLPDAVGTLAIRDDVLVMLGGFDAAPSGAENTAGLSFTEMEPGEVCYFNGSVEVPDDGAALSFSTTYKRASNQIEVGLLSETGEEYAQLVEGGSATDMKITDIPAGSYRFFVRSCSENRNPQSLAQYTQQVSGAINFSIDAGAISAAPDAPAESALNAAITSAIIEHNRGQYPGGDFACANFVTLASEGGGPADTNQIDTVIVYGMALYQEYGYSGAAFSNTGGSHTATALTFHVDESGGYTLTEYWTPRDGSYYVQDIRDKFPEGVQEAALDTQRYVLAQIQDCYRQAVEYGSVDTASVIGRLLETVCTSPHSFASSPSDYIDAHPIEYRELTYYGQYTLQYCFDKFLEGGQTGLEGHIMATVCEDILEGFGETLPEVGPAGMTGQDWFDALLAHGGNILEPYLPEELRADIFGA